MGLSNSPDIFQSEMNKLLGDLEYVRAYLDDLLVITKKADWNDHLLKLEEVFRRLRKADLKVHLRKFFFGKTELEYLGFIITRTGIKPLPQKVEAIQALSAPTNKQIIKMLGRIQPAYSNPAEYYGKHI